MDRSAGGGGIGIAGVLTIVFVVLKLVGVISWSWWWVLSPIWISLAICAAILIIAAIVIILIAIFGQRN